jgi:hypothetical protein
MPPHNHITTPQSSSTLTMADVPAIKPWCKEDKDKLLKLIEKGKVDITNTEDTEYINSICLKYFRKQKVDNFRFNFCSFARSVEIAGFRACLAARG